jgi:hypothetical protein
MVRPLFLFVVLVRCLSFFFTLIKIFLFGILFYSWFPADLYHCGVGKSKKDRYIAISIYSNGLSKVPDIADRPSIEPRKFKPWACRKPINGTMMMMHPDQATKLAREKIYKMIDQPGDCFRDGIDTIDFEQIENDDLSKTTPPGFGEENNWMLVDSSEKMRQCIQEIEVSRRANGYAYHFILPDTY